MKNSKKKYIKIFKLPEEKHFVNSRWILEKPATKKKKCRIAALYIYTYTNTQQEIGKLSNKFEFIEGTWGRWRRRWRRRSKSRVEVKHKICLNIL